MVLLHAVREDEPRVMDRSSPLHRKESKKQIRRSQDESTGYGDPRVMMHADHHRPTEQKNVEWDEEEKGKRKEGRGAVVLREEDEEDEKKSETEKSTGNKIASAPKFASAASVTKRNRKRGRQSK